MKKIPSKKILSAAVFLFAFTTVFAQNKKSAEVLKNESLKLETIQDSIDYLKSNSSLAETENDLRSILYFTGTLQEQLGLYTDASASYARAAGIAAKDAVNMPKVTSEQLAISAVRASLCAGDWETADSYLNSAIRTSKNEEIIAQANLYSVWSALCRASSVGETKDSVSLLKAYAAMDSMKSVKSQVLLTLWYLTGQEEFASTLKKEFPSSPETSIVNGNSQIMRVPFWYFVPRQNGNSNSQPAQNSSAKKDEKISASESEKNSAAKTEVPLSQKKSGKKQQLGLFKDKKNADEIVLKARAKGFDAYCYSEKRSSGNTYFIVVVDENASLTMGKKLKDAGFDCYTIE